MSKEDLKYNPAGEQQHSQGPVNPEPASGGGIPGEQAPIGGGINKPEFRPPQAGEPPGSPEYTVFTAEAPRGQPDLPESREDRLELLADLYQTEIHLPNVSVFLSEEQEAALRAGLETLSNEELASEIATLQDEIDRELCAQWPRGLAMP